MPEKWILRQFGELGGLELYRLIVLRELVFVVEQNCAYLDCDGKDIDSHHLYTSGENNEALACLRIVQPGISYPEVSIGRVVTHPKHRGTNLGRKLLAEGMRSVELIYGRVPVRISAQAHLKDYYAGSGFTQVSEPYLEDNIPHIEMLYTS